MTPKAAGDEADVRRRVGSFLQRHFPQIAIHGGDAAVEAVDLETGEVWIQLGGACSGCGISPMTVQAIQHRLVQAVPEVEVVHADAGLGATSGGLSASAGGRDAFSDAPF